jgi:predicted nucleotidyltransferase
VRHNRMAMKTEQTGARLPRALIAEFCRRHHIRKLAVFGSVLHGDARPDSDLDVLVEFERTGPCRRCGRVLALRA